MKQHITEPQLDELFELDYGIEGDPHVRQFLKDGWNIDLPEEKITRYNETTYIEHWTISLHDITIGILFQILGDDIFCGHNVNFKKDDKPYPYWMITLCGEEADNGYNDQALCNALWKAVLWIISKRAEKGGSTWTIQ